MHVDLPFMNVDIEPTNRCNAKCYFCPRDQTPHQGLMSPETFEQALARTIEFRAVSLDTFEKDVQVSLCGLGEPLLNKHTPSFIEKVRAADLPCLMASNAALLTEQVGQRLLDAGLQAIQINVGEQGDEYEDIYKLPWERTRDNVLRFAEQAGDQCRVQIVIVDHRGDVAHHNEMRDFWRSYGLDDFIGFELINRGGALFVDAMQYETFPELDQARSLLERDGDVAVCQAPFALLFVGYDGQYYLCCSDWKKEVPLGSVFDASFVDVAGAKLAHVMSREPVCKSCNHDPVNRVVDWLRAQPAGGGDQAELKDVLDDLFESDDLSRAFVAKVGATVPPLPSAAASDGRKLIPVREA
jgi:MoaA/NifB/PqqE/SkfB family radical SAM enzyme